MHEGSDASHCPLQGPSAELPGSCEAASVQCSGDGGRRTWSPQHEAASDSERQAGTYYMQALYTRWPARAFTLLYHTKRNRKPQATMTGKVCNPRPLKLLPRLMVADRKTKTERQRHR